MCHFDPLGKPTSHHYKALKFGISRDCHNLAVILKFQVSTFDRFRVIKRQKRRFSEGFVIYRIYISMPWQGLPVTKKGLLTGIYTLY